MPTELTSKQCDAYVEEYEITIQYHPHALPDSRWWCWLKSDNAVKGETRVKTITNHWHDCNPDWTPPEIWDAERAIQYVLDKRLSIIPSFRGYSKIHIIKEAPKSLVSAPSDFYKTIYTSKQFADIIQQWEREHTHAPDKPEPTREQTAVELLTKVRKYIMNNIDSCLRSDIDTFLKEADHVDDKLREIAEKHSLFLCDLLTVGRDQFVEWEKRGLFFSESMRQSLVDFILLAIREATEQQQKRIEELEKILTVAQASMFPERCDSCDLLRQVKHQIQQGIPSIPPTQPTESEEEAQDV